MAGPEAESPAIEAIEALIGDDGAIAVHVTPGARTERLEIVGGALRARVRARAQNGEANRAVARQLAAALCIAPSRIELLRGATSRHKMFRLR